MSYTKSKIKYNQREKEVQEEAIKGGWKVLYKGWPDFLFYKEIDKEIFAFFAEIKRNPTKKIKKTFDVKLSPEQNEMHRILIKLGLDVRVIYKD